MFDCICIHFIDFTDRSGPSTEEPRTTDERNVMFFIFERSSDSNPNSKRIRSKSKSVGKSLNNIRIPSCSTTIGRFLHGLHYTETPDPGGRSTRVGECRVCADRASKNRPLERPILFIIIKKLRKLQSIKNSLHCIASHSPIFFILLYVLLPHSTTPQLCSIFV